MYQYYTSTRPILAQQNRAEPLKVAALDIFSNHTFDFILKGIDYAAYCIESIFGERIKRLFLSDCP